MKLKTRLLPFESAYFTVILDQRLAKKLDVKLSDRVVVRYDGRSLTAIVNIAKDFPEDSIGIYTNLARVLGVSEGDEVEIEATNPPISLQVIRKKLQGLKLEPDEVHLLVKDIVEGKVNELELAALVTAFHFQGMSPSEIYDFTVSMVGTGQRLNLKKRPILDKHSLGGVPGDKTSLLVVPIIASFGYTIPKTSSRAITSAAGTADRMEVLAPVNFSIEEIEKIVERTNACIVWGGSLNLAPADDIIIRVEYPLGIDPFFIPSILAKKLAVGSTHIVLDIPTGKGTKVKTLGEARRISQDFLEISRMLNMNLQTVATYAEEPIGHAIGPALEAREALQALRTLNPPDLVDKAASLAGVLLEMVGVQDGYELAMESLRSGKAERKLREIIEAQGGDPNIRPDDLPIGDKTYTIYAGESGFVYHIDNSLLANMGKIAGAPVDKGAGVYVHVKLGEKVKKGDPLITVYSSSSSKLQLIEKLTEETASVLIGRTAGRKMLLERIQYQPARLTTLER
ncbi:MAG: AMP phosphorylase [Thermofilum sp.]|nr:AMP phosphorylase [Thermofilum sp.]